LGGGLRSKWGGGPRSPARSGVLVAIAVLAGAAVVAGAAAVTGTAVTVSEGHAAPAPACGRGAPELLAQTVGAVAAQIYAGEIASSETFKDRHQVERYAPLLWAVADDQPAATQTAVTSLVYSHTHIVRLRVTRGPTLLADVGGPYILAPLAGILRLHGRTVGHYVLSVQDDVGYVKIESHFIGAPLVLRAGPKNVPVPGQLAPGPVNIPEHGPVTYRHVVYQAYSFKASAFPSGPLRISVLMPVPAALSRESCAVVKNSELALVARRVAGQFSLSPGNFSTYVNLVRTLTGGYFYIRAGSRQLAGSTRSGPARLPISGSVSYLGASYEVSSFSARTSVGPVRIYALLAE
jgi:hypothetical protein